MVSGETIKRVLYSVIEEIGKENIQTSITSNIESSQEYIDTIISRCITNLIHESIDDDIIIVSLFEALLHFMLTVCTLPSERKIQVKNALTIDVVIPNLHSLSINPDRSIIVQFIKDKSDLYKTAQLESLQPSTKNIWLISTKPLLTSKYTEYSLSSNASSHKFSNIILDVSRFLTETEDKSFRIIP